MPQYRNSEFIAIRCIGAFLDLVLSVGSIISEAGLIQIVYNLRTEQEIIPQEIWKKSKRNIGYIIILGFLGIIFAIPVFFVFSFVIGFFTLSPRNPLSDSHLRFTLIVYLTAFFIGMFFIIAYRVLIIHGLSGSKNLSVCIPLVKDNIGLMLTLGVIFLIPVIVVSGLPGIFILGLQVHLSLFEMIALLLQAYIALWQMLEVRLLILLVTIFITPLKSSVYTLVYLEFAKEKDYPELALNELET
jgi:hypothetical protein